MHIRRSNSMGPRDSETPNRVKVALLALDHCHAVPLQSRTHDEARDLQTIAFRTIKLWLASREVSRPSRESDCQVDADDDMLGPIPGPWLNRTEAADTEALQ